MPSPRLSFTLAMPHPETHLFEVTLDARDLPGDTWDFALPAWTPGSYKIRDYARHVQDFEATGPDGEPVRWQRVDKQTWRVTPPRSGRRRVTLRYRVYAHDLTVRTSHLDATHGYLNGTTVFLYAVDARDVPIDVRVKPPRGWHVDTGLPAVAGKRNAFRADDYDHLADCPMEIGTHRRVDFDVDGKRHRIAFYGHGNEDLDRVRADVETIVREEAAMWGTDLPYDDYLFIVHASDARGGLEHRNSNTSQVDRWAFQPPKDYEGFLSLEAHEYFHTWNVKGLRPAAHDPFDYAREVYTDLLWVMEGFTGYYDHLVLARAGLMTEDRYREYLGETITKYRGQPGRFKLSLAESSRLAWVKLYQADENWPNSGVSYYLKGELVGWALDIALRERTRGRQGLDDLMRTLYARHGPGKPGLPEDGVRATLEEFTGDSWGAWWRKHVTGTDEVNFERVARRIGWRLRAVAADDDEKEAAKRGEYASEGAWLGANVRTHRGLLKVKTVLSGSPAERAGLAPGDVLVALDGHRTGSTDFLRNRLRERAEGDVATLAFFRRDALVTTEVTLASPPPEKWVLEEDPRADAAAKRRRREWLKPYAKPARHARVAAEAESGGRRHAREVIEDRGE